MTKLDYQLQGKKRRETVNNKYTGIETMLFHYDCVTL